MKKLIFLCLMVFIPMLAYGSLTLGTDIQNYYETKESGDTAILVHNISNTTTGTAFMTTDSNGDWTSYIRTNTGHIYTKGYVIADGLVLRDHDILGKTYYIYMENGIMEIECRSKC